MTDFKDYVNVIANNPKSYLVKGFACGNLDNINYANGDKVVQVYFNVNNVDNSKMAMVYKYRRFDNFETRFVISCGDKCISINKEDKGNKNYEIRTSIQDRPCGETIMVMGFLDAAFYVDNLRNSKEELIQAKDWTPELILGKMLDVIKNVWEDEEWEKYSEMVFDFLKPALSLGLMDTKDAWLKYVKKYEQKYEQTINIINANIIQNNEDVEKAEKTYELYKNAREWLEMDSQDTFDVNIIEGSYRK